MNNYEHTATIYLAGPIDGVPPEWATNWRKKAKKILEVAGFKILDPTEGKDLNMPGINDTVYSPEQIVEADLAAIKKADILLVDWRKIPFLRRLKNFIRTGHSDPMRTGTTMEIRYAHEMGIRIYSFGTMRQGYWMKYHIDISFLTLEDVLKHVILENSTKIH
jgi:nucleoside 2-deoxyribosyltransferase